MNLVTMLCQSIQIILVLLHCCSHNNDRLWILEWLITQALNMLTKKHNMYLMKISYSLSLSLSLWVCDCVFLCMSFTWEKRSFFFCTWIRVRVLLVREGMTEQRWMMMVMVMVRASYPIQIGGNLVRRIESLSLDGFLLKRHNFLGLQSIYLQFEGIFIHFVEFVAVIE